MLGVLGIRHVIGLTVFFLGFILQFEAHVHLASGRSTPGSSGSYFVPHAGLFRLVSSPHYLAEMILYLGTGPFPPVFCWCGDNNLSLLLVHRHCYFSGFCDHQPLCLRLGGRQPDHDRSGHPQLVPQDLSKLSKTPPRPDSLDFVKGKKVNGILLLLLDSPA